MGYYITAYSLRSEVLYDIIIEFDVPTQIV
jgi:hypothetical protein